MLTWHAPDFSHDEAIRMLRTLYGEGAEAILQHRWQIIKYVGLNPDPFGLFVSAFDSFSLTRDPCPCCSTWRPLRGPVLDWPLAVCDAQTFNQVRDAQAADAVYPEWAYENVLVHHHPDQQWYYFSAMEEHETLLFKGADSDPTACGRELIFLLRVASSGFHERLDADGFGCSLPPWLISTSSNRTVGRHA